MHKPASKIEAGFVLPERATGLEPATAGLGSEGSLMSCRVELGR
jgi:hypothetical protein